MDIFYNYIKEQIKSIPFSTSIDVYSLNIDEEHFIKYLNEKYDMHLIYLNNKIIFFENEIDSFEKTLENDERISYYLLLNNQIYMNYNTYNYNKDFKCDCKKYYLSSISFYSSHTNKDSFINLLSYISEYIKKNK